MDTLTYYRNFTLCAPTPFQLDALRCLCARTHGATRSSTRVVKVEDGCGRDTNAGEPVFAHCEDSDAIVTVEYTVAVPVERRARIASQRRNGRVVARGRGPWRAMYAFLRGRWVLWAD